MSVPPNRPMVFTTRGQIHQGVPSSSISITGLVEHIGGVIEAQVAVEVPAEVLGGGVADALLQTHHLHILGHHVDDKIGGQTSERLLNHLIQSPYRRGVTRTGRPL